MVDFFEFFGLKPKFQIDIKELKLLYYEKMRQFHPDMQIDASDQEKEETFNLSSINNDAYKTLKDFHLRLKYILDTFYPGDEAPSKSLPQLFLMEMMDMNEELMELKMDFDEVKASKMRSEIEGKLEEMKASVQAEIEDSIVSETDGVTFDKINEYLLQRNYLLRALENMKAE
jgi:molecular chaperone HscB